MTYLKRTIAMESKSSAKTLTEYYALSEDSTVQVRHFDQQGERSNYEISTYSRKADTIIKGGEEITEQEFISAIQKASDLIKARIY
jgi:hypothetical protein